jgi:hypothetical protein
VWYARAEFSFLRDIHVSASLEPRLDHSAPLSSIGVAPAIIRVSLGHGGTFVIFLMLRTHPRKVATEYSVRSWEDSSMS